MLRKFVSAAVILALVVGVSLAQQQKNAQKGAQDTPTRATITKVDPVKNNITLKYKDKTGKEVEKDFELKGDVKMFDEVGKVATITAYRVGNNVLIIEREGKLLELRKDKDAPKPGKDK
jgi:hypothetical protein